MDVYESDSAGRVLNQRGIGNVKRMIWYLESEKLEEIRLLMEHQELDVVKVWLSIDEEVSAELAVEKNGKRLKTLPRTLMKNEEILEQKAIIKELKEQKHRAKERPEHAMVDGTEIGAYELRKLRSNLVLAPLLYGLVWTDGGRNGFWTEEEKQEKNISIRYAGHQIQPQKNVACMPLPTGSP